MLATLEDILANQGIPHFVQSTRDDPRTIDSDWVHDKYDDNVVARAPIRPARRASPERNTDLESSKLKIENVHYDLTEEDLDDLFNRIGPVEKLVLTYDRAGRSNGIAFVTYERAIHAKQAIREFDGANANGQPIRLSLVSNHTAKPRNPFDTAVRPARSLAERITAPQGGGRTRSESPIRHTDVSGPVPDGIDRYVPGQRGTRSRSPMPRRRDGRRPGARKERGGERQGGGAGPREGGRSGARPKKTQEELDAEMEDYWGTGGAKGAEDKNVVAPAATGLETDIEMAE